MNKNSKIYVAGHTGLIGSALVRSLNFKGYTNLIYKTHSQLNLINQESVDMFFKNEKPEYVFLAAAKVGGINANSAQPADFIYDNLMIQNNIIKASYNYGIKKLLFLGSSCIYPRNCEQPMKEEALLTGTLEPTNEAYAIAKIAGLKMCEYYNKQYGTKFISCMPTNIYGPNDNFNLNSSHVIPAMIKKFYECKLNNTKEISVWGTGNAMREFLYVDDLASACIYLMDNYNKDEFINVGTGKDITIKELAFTIRDIIGYKGKIKFDDKKPEGNPRKLLDVTKMDELGWKYTIELREGLELTVDWFVKNKNL